MRVVPQLIAHLRADATVSGIVGNKIYADYPPQGDDYPFVTLTINSGMAYGTLSNCSAKGYSARCQIEAIGETRSQTEQLMEAIEDSIAGMQSGDSTHPINGVAVADGFDWLLMTPTDGSDQRVFVCSQDFHVDYIRII